MTEYSKGDLVRINSIEKTDSNHGLDSGGEMEGMVGKVFRVQGSDGDAVYIENKRKSFVYSWDKRDLSPVDGKEPDPIIFSFDTDKLVV